MKVKKAVITALSLILILFYCGKQTPVETGKSESEKNVLNSLSKKKPKPPDTRYSGEFCVKNEQLPELFDILKKVEKEVDCVFTIDIATRLDPDGSNPTRKYIDAAGLWVAPNGKTNVALGRPLIQED